MNIIQIKRLRSLFPPKKDFVEKISGMLGFVIGAFIFIAMLVIVMHLISSVIHAQVRIPGADESQKLEAAGTLLRMVDTFLFSWGARIFAGICILSAGWGLKEQRYTTAVICVVAAIVIATAPHWIKNIFAIGGGGIFN